MLCSEQGREEYSTSRRLHFPILRLYSFETPGNVQHGTVMESKSGARTLGSWMNLEEGPQLYFRHDMSVFWERLRVWNEARFVDELHVDVTGEQILWCPSKPTLNDRVRRRRR